MKKAGSIFSESLRFRRWSRKGYAIFRSLGRGVTIGQLHYSLAEKSDAKSGIFDLKLSENNFSGKNPNNADDDAPDLPDLFSEKIFIINQLSMTDVAAAVSGYQRIIINQRLESTL